VADELIEHHTSVNYPKGSMIFLQGVDGHADGLQKLLQRTRLEARAPNADGRIQCRRVCCISGSRVAPAFLVELGAAMMVASTMVPKRSNSRRSSSNPVI